MELEIISFGKIAEVINNQRIDVSGLSTTDELKAYLEKSFPLLSEMKYKLAVNKNIIQENHDLKNNDIIAIMPPFSGG
ncbi:MoaD/ThiS family protein [Pedobacter sp. L105]|uniref:MoaD/ThiS family protein n=1 Tax=Pedobacter sp. L105 TaxID=1641871 RepID=UPI00131AB60B|nr:MoaD/ThiS family protein [Pedobacter sp. L105]